MIRAGRSLKEQQWKKLDFLVLPSRKSQADVEIVTVINDNDESSPLNHTPWDFTNFGFDFSNFLIIIRCQYSCSGSFVLVMRCYYLNSARFFFCFCITISEINDESSHPNCTAYDLKIFRSNYFFIDRIFFEFCLVFVFVFYLLDKQTKN